VIILILTAIGPLIAPYPTETANAAQRLQPPNTTHWLGTDENGIDIFSRILAAPRTDVLIAVIATALSVAIGAPLGVLTGYFEGARRRIASLASEGLLRLLDVVQAFPVFILAMVLVAIRGASLTNIVAAVAFVNMPVFLRLVRSEILSLRERPYAEAARALGNSDLRIGFRHLLPNALPPILVQVSVTVGFAILLTAGLSFVGAGVAPPTPELGAMIASGAKSLIIGQWWPSLFPGIALGLMVFTFAVAGETLGRLLEPGGARGHVGERIPASTVPLGAGTMALGSGSPEPAVPTDVDADPTLDEWHQR
jgi:peptide/nickel transport system permease protein